MIDVWKAFCEIYRLLCLPACIPTSRCFLQLRVISGVTRFILISRLCRFIIPNAFLHFLDNSILPKVARSWKYIEVKFSHVRNECLIPIHLWDSTPFDTWFFVDVSNVSKIFIIYNILSIFLINVYMSILLYIYICYSYIELASRRYVQLKRTDT